VVSGAGGGAISFKAKRVNRALTLPDRIDKPAFLLSTTCLRAGRAKALGQRSFIRGSREISRVDFAALFRPSSGVRRGRLIQDIIYQSLGVFTHSNSAGEEKG
jgi:hypothetical protein